MTQTRTTTRRYEIRQQAPGADWVYFCTIHNLQRALDWMRFYRNAHPGLAFKLVCITKKVTTETTERTIA